jgi:hypothetical protein
MAFEGIQQQLPGITASASLTTKQYYAMKVSGDATVTVCAGTTDKAIGILQGAPASGERADVCVFGVSKAHLGGTVTAGDLVASDGNGKVISITAGTDTTVYALGRCLVGGNADELGTIFVCPGGRAA